MIRSSDWFVTVRTAVRVTPLYVAEIVAVPAVDRTDTWNAPVETNAGTVTVAGTVAIAVLLLASETAAPPLATGAVNVSVADVAVVPVWTVDGFRLIDASAPPGCGGGGGVTVSVADRLTPLYVPVIVTVVVAATAVVAMWLTTTRLFTPSGTTMSAGTGATTELLLVKVTLAPPAGAGAVSVTVVDAAPGPPCTLVGPTLTVVSVAPGVGSGGGVMVPVTVRVAVRVVPAYVAERTALVVAPTVLVDTGDVAELAPAATVTFEATVATVLLLDSDTTAPPVGAGAVRVTVAVTLPPPVTVEGLRPTALRAAAGGGDGVVTVHPDSRTVVGVADPSLTSTVQSAGRV
jgi:hypothetical protein